METLSNIYASIRTVGVGRRGNGHQGQTGPSGRWQCVRGAVPWVGFARLLILDKLTVKQILYKMH